MSFLHVKREGSACGSVGTVTFNNRYTIGWSTPYSGKNTIEGCYSYVKG
jgi:hypothetical protein